MRVEGRTVLITGASSGIGAATAVTVARKGARPLLLARNKEKLAELAGRISREGGQARAYPVDCGDPHAVAEVAGVIADDVGQVDILVNNAGAGRFLFFDETDPQEFGQMMAAPYFAAVYVTRALLPAMLDRDEGHIVNVNTPIAFMPWPGAAGYAAARWAIRGFNEALRLDLHGTGVKVTHVVPGKVSSGYFEHNPGAEEAIPGVAKLIRTLTPEQVADVVVEAVEGDKRVVFAPLALRLLVWQARFLPRVTEFLMVRTGRKRPIAAGADSGGFQ